MVRSHQCPFDAFIAYRSQQKSVFGLSADKLLNWVNLIKAGGVSC